jgi:phage shock protein PspC (stress-responsive transcriptional regulator)
MLVGMEPNDPDSPSTPPFTPSPPPFMPPPTGPRRQLRRPLSGRVLTGAGAGLANYLGVDVALVRLAFVLLALLGGSGVACYLAAWLLMPEEGADHSIAERLLGRAGGA